MANHIISIPTFFPFRMIGLPLISISFKQKHMRKAMGSVVVALQ